MRQNVQDIFFKTPKSKQTLCLSATLAPDMLRIVKKFVKPVRLSVVFTARSPLIA
jgi:superfamily II DNA/RNA helicase